MPTIAHILQPGIEKHLDDLERSIPSTLGPKGAGGVPPATHVIPLGPHGYLVALAQPLKQGEQAGEGRKGGEAVKPDHAQNIAKKAKEERVTIPEAVIGESLMHVPQGQLKGTIGYLAALGNRKFIPAISQGFAKSELHPIPSVLPMQAGERAGYLAQPQALGTAPMRNDKSVNPNGVTPAYLSI